MKKFKSLVITIGIYLSLSLIAFGVGYVKYKIWRAEHPYAKTWVFFVPSKG